MVEQANFQAGIPLAILCLLSRRSHLSLLGSKGMDIGSREGKGKGKGGTISVCSHVSCIRERASLRFPFAGL